MTSDLATFRFIDNYAEIHLRVESS